MNINLGDIPSKNLRLLASILRLPPEHLERLSSSDGGTTYCPKTSWLVRQEKLVSRLPADFRRGGVGAWVSQMAKKVVMKASGGPDHLAIRAAEDGLRLEAMLGPRDAPTVLCHAHQKLHPGLIRVLFHFLSHEVADRADPVRRHPKHVKDYYLKKYDVPSHLGERRQALIETEENQTNDCHTDEIRDWGDRMMGISALWTKSNHFRELELGLLGARKPPPPPFLTPDGRHLNTPAVRLVEPGAKLPHLAFPCEACAIAVVGGHWRALVDLRAGIQSRTMAEESERLLRKEKDRNEKKKRRHHRHHHHHHHNVRDQSPGRIGRSDRTEITDEADMFDSRPKLSRRHSSRNDLMPLVDTWLDIMDRKRYYVEDFHFLLGPHSEKGYYANIPSVSRLLVHVSDELADKLMRVRLCEADRRHGLREQDRRLNEKKHRRRHLDTRPMAKPRPGRQPLNGGDGCLECPSRMTTKHGHRLPLPLLPVDRDGWINLSHDEEDETLPVSPPPQELDPFVEEGSERDRRQRLHDSPQSHSRSHRSTADSALSDPDSSSVAFPRPRSCCGRLPRHSRVDNRVAIHEPSEACHSLAVSVYEMGTASTVSRTTASSVVSRATAQTGLTHATTQSSSQAGSCCMSRALGRPESAASHTSCDYEASSRPVFKHQPGAFSSIIDQYECENGDNDDGESEDGESEDESDKASHVAVVSAMSATPASTVSPCTPGTSETRGTEHTDNTNPTPLTLTPPTPSPPTSPTEPELPTTPTLVKRLTPQPKGGTMSSTSNIHRASRLSVHSVLTPSQIRKGKYPAEPAEQSPQTSPLTAAKSGKPAAASLLPVPRSKLPTVTGSSVKPLPPKTIPKTIPKATKAPVAPRAQDKNDNISAL